MTAAVRDYSIVGPERDQAVEAGRADGEWFQADIDPARMRELTQRTNLRPAIDMVIWLGLAIGLGVLAWSLRGSWWAVPAFVAYGAIVGGTSDARWHECGHGTAFRTSWLNDLIYYPASFFLAREATYWRWSHFRHHTDTIIVGRDPEIVFPRPPSLGAFALTYTNLVGGPTLMAGTIRHAFGRLDDVTHELVPSSEIRRVVWEARVYTTIWMATIVWAVATTSLYPLLLIGGPTIYGAWAMVFFGATQHTGLREDTLDHRWSTRTVLMNPIFRFLYLNMNYHVEHHMFPAVPYHRLPQLHAEIADQLAPPLPSTWAAYRQIVGAIREQSVDPSWEIDLAVPDVEGARGAVVQGFEWPSGDGAEVIVDVASIGVGEMRRTQIDGASVVVCRIDDGSLHAVASRCTHGDAELADGALIGCEIECPKHNGRFDVRTGAPTRRPVSEPIETFEIDGSGHVSRKPSSQKAAKP